MPEPYAKQKKVIIYFLIQTVYQEKQTIYQF